MKMYMLALLGTLMFACNQRSNTANADDAAVHKEHISNEPALNNGAKWKADSITNHNVANLKTIADNFKIKPFVSINDYQILGNDLNTGLSKMLNECKMTGADHEALHQWLEPVLKETNELKNVTDTTAGRLTFTSLDKQIGNYHKYFE